MRAGDGSPAVAPSQPVDVPWAVVARRALVAAYSVLLVRQTLLGGLPVDRWRLLAWILAALAISCVGRPRRQVVRLVADWSPFVALLVAYSYSRGVADTLGMPIQSRSVLAVERALFLGEVPSVWLQELLLPRGTRTPVRWWEIGVTLVYLSHFVTPFVLAGVLWVRDRAAWVVYTSRFAILSVAAVVTFALIPTAPPWLASEWGLTDDLVRPVGRGWERVSLKTAGTWLEVGRGWVNPVAAIPSLHTAFALLVAVTLWPRAGHPVARAALVAYPVAMGFVLVYGAEHYVVDVVLGGVYVAVAIVLQRWVTGWWRGRSRAGATS
jgi:hypothetical protein